MSYAITGTDCITSSADLSRHTSAEGNTKGTIMLEGLTAPLQRSLCRVEAVALTLEPKDQEILKKAVMDPNWTISGLYIELKNRGITLGEKPMTAHRKGLCSCSKT